jgi:hypothetical protein
VLERTNTGAAGEASLIAVTDASRNCRSSTQVQLSQKLAEYLFARNC